MSAVGLQTGEQTNGVWNRQACAPVKHGKQRKMARKVNKRRVRSRLRRECYKIPLLQFRAMAGKINSHAWPVTSPRDWCRINIKTL